MYSRIVTVPKNKSFFLFGPRGTGKTTWVKKSFPDAIYIDLLESRLFNELLVDPQKLTWAHLQGFLKQPVFHRVRY